MSSKRQLPGMLLVALVLSGCHPTRPFYFFDDGDLSHYKEVATEIEYPDVEQPRLAEVDGAIEPFTLRNSEAREIWDLPLEEAVQNALANGKVLRSIGGQVLQASDLVLRGADQAQTVYSPALVDTNARFGTAAALSAFDARFTTSMFWERNERPVNLFFPGFISPVFEQDLGTFQAQLSKQSASGGQFFLRNNTSYELNNNPSNRFPSSWTTNMEIEARQPLLQGASVDYNRIAGPGAVPGFNNGVVIARINTDIALADFETGVRNLVADVEIAYWELYFAYRNLNAVKAGRDSALETWRKVYALYKIGAQGGEADKEAQAREQFFFFRFQVENALSNVYSIENRLRYLMGLASTDGRLIRPADEPTTARVTFDWYEVHSESLVRSVELRRQKWRIKEREMELIAARNYLLPRLDAVARYRWNGLGDHFASADQGPELDNAVQTLTNGDFQDWQLGLQMNVPLGFRRELAGVRNAELQLTRERTVLREEELEQSHLLAEAIRDLDRGYVLSVTNFNRRRAAFDEVQAVIQAFEAGTSTLDLVLDAQRRLADAESAYFRSVIDYNLSIAKVHLRKGSLLEYNGVYLAEGPWPGKAYFDAEERARERDAAIFLDYGFTRPEVLSRGPMMQNSGEQLAPFGEDVILGEPTPAIAPDAEELPPGTLPNGGSPPPGGVPIEPSGANEPARLNPGGGNVPLPQDGPRLSSAPGSWGIDGDRRSTGSNPGGRPVRGVSFQGGTERETSPIESSLAPSEYQGWQKSQP